MAAKYQLMTELYRRTGIAVAKNPQAWQSFLAAACRNYKCRFDEQLLIYAQRPDAIAVAELDTWNKRFKRWVNKDSKGIAVFDPKGRRNTLKYYFDVSDTHDGYYGSRPVPIWQMNGRYEQSVIERLSDRFGNAESADLASALIETAKNAVEDNLQDYFSQLKDFTRDSFLEELDDLNVEVCYRRLVTNSVAFMLMSRCGLDTNGHFEREDFEDIINFNTPATINALGIATSDISEMALKEISLAIQNLQIAEKGTNRTFVPESKSQYNIGRIQPERSENNERNHLQQAGRLSYSRPDITDRARASAWQIRFDAQGLSGAAQESDIPQPADNGQAERTSAPDRTDSTTTVGASDEAATSRTGRDRGTESESPDAVGRTDEQYSQSGGGSDTDRADLQLDRSYPAEESIANETEVRANLPTVEEQIEMIAEAEDEKSSAFAISQEDIDSVLLLGSGFQNGKYRIYRQFQKQEDSKNNITFLKNHRQRSRPACGCQFACTLRHVCRYGFEVLHSSDVDDQRVVRRTALCRINFLGSFGIQRISAKTIYGLGRDCRQTAVFQNFSCFFDRALIYVIFCHPGNPCPHMFLPSFHLFQRTVFPSAHTVLIIPFSGAVENP